MERLPATISPIRCGGTPMSLPPRPSAGSGGSPAQRGQIQRLQRVLPDWAAPEVPVQAVFASARYRTPKLRAFIDLAAENVRPGG